MNLRTPTKDQLVSPAKSQESTATNKERQDLLLKQMMGQLKVLETRIHLEMTMNGTIPDPTLSSIATDFSTELDQENADVQLLRKIRKGIETLEANQDPNFFLEHESFGGSSYRFSEERLATLKQKAEASDKFQYLCSIFSVLQGI